VEPVRLEGEVLRILRNADRVRHRDELLDEREDVLGRQHARVLGHLDAEALVQLVAADLRQVVALGNEEERAEEVARVVEGRRLARPLLLEDLDQRLFLARLRLLVDEADHHRERGLIRQVLLPAFLDRELGLTELVVAELDGERAGVVLDRRDVVDRLAEAFAQEPVEGLTLDVDQVGEVENVLETRERLARAWRSDRLGQRNRASLGRYVMRGEAGSSGNTACGQVKPGATSANLPV